jgi:hypothetical protein
MQGLLADLREAQAKLRLRSDFDPGVTGCADALARLEARMSLRPRVVVLGESNAGKTSLVNLLLDQALLPESVVANTRRPMVLRFAETVLATGITHSGRLDLRRDGIEPHDGSTLESLEIGLPSERLASFDLVDTPALSTSVQLDPLRLGAADLLLWCTVATQAWKESERRLWMTISGRHRRYAILVATHEDSLRDDEDRRKIRARLTAETAECFRAIALVCATGRGKCVSLGQREHTSAAELDALIANSLSVIARQRYRAGYRLANHIVGRALKLMERGRRLSVPRLNSLATQK